MGCRNLAHVVLDVGPSARSSQQVPAAIQYADAAPLAPRLACLGLPPVAVPAAGEVVCCTWAGASCRPAPAYRTAPCVATPSPPQPRHALLPNAPCPTPWLSALIPAHLSRLGVRPSPPPLGRRATPCRPCPLRPLSVHPPGRPRPRLPRRLPTCPLRPLSVPPPARPPAPPRLGARLPPPGPTPTPTCPHWPAAAPVGARLPPHGPLPPPPCPPHHRPA